MNIFISSVIIFLYSTTLLACDLSEAKIVHGKEGVTLHYLFSTSNIKVTVPFSIDLCLYKNGKQLVGVDRLKFNVTMPKHGHGMNYRPTIKKIDGGHYSIKGILLHMPGLWQFDFDLKIKGQRQKFLVDHSL